MASLRKRLGLLTAALMVCGAAYLLLRPARLRVDVAPAVRGAMQVTVDEEGETRVRDRYVIAAPVTGRLERIKLDEGYPVEPDSVVARMRPIPLDPRTRATAAANLAAAEAAKREADARVEQANAALDQARRDLKRARQLRTQGTISAGEFEAADLAATARLKERDAAVFSARAADFGVEAARAALLAAGGRDDDGAVAVVEIRSPVQGQVLRVLEESERVVQLGTPLLELGDPSVLEIVVDVLSTDAVKVDPGDRILIEDWGGDRPLEARVRLVEPSGFTKVSALGVEEQRVNVVADFVAAPEKSLGDGFRVEARIIVWEGTEVLKIPSSALFRHAGEWSVFVVEAGRAQRREIREGQRNAFEVQVLDGIREGEVVILHPSDLIDDGVRVTSS